jgi:isopenicillin N synthase-like dioxygenase
VDSVRDVPVIDVAPLLAGDDERVASELDRACRDTGFFYVVGHGIDADLPARLDALAREFFATSPDEKAAIAMARGGKAWRGWFPLGGELTSGAPDRKEGIYFGAELDADDPRVRAGLPLHGRNLFPARPAELREAVLAHLDAMTSLGHTLMRGLALGLGLDAGWFEENLTGDPTILFRIFRYPPSPGDDWGVGEHTDYGLLTILRQDDRGGLEVRGATGWVEAPPIPSSFVCNLGDMLERITAGRYRSTPHRVRNTSPHDRVSFAFFFDPAWDSEVAPLPLGDPAVDDDVATRWDGASVHAFEGTYGEYLLAKVAKVFPELGEQTGLP